MQHRSVTTQWITIQPAFAGYLALPPAGSGPGLLLWQEIFGVNEHIRTLAEQYALDGFVVLAPDAFWRQAPRVELGYDGDDRQRATALMQAYTAGDALADIAAAMAVLRARPEVAGPSPGAAKVGTIGWCLGGRMAFLTAATARADAAVAYYGGGIQNQLDKVGGVGCAVQFHYAGSDAHSAALAHGRALEFLARELY